MHVSDNNNVQGKVLFLGYFFGGVDVVNFKSGPFRVTS